MFRKTKGKKIREAKKINQDTIFPVHREG